MLLNLFLPKHGFSCLCMCNTYIDLDLRCKMVNVRHIGYRATSATTHVVLGQFKTCAILLGGFFLFGSNPGTISICGAITALVGMSFYTYLNLNPQQQLMKATSRQPQYILPKSKLSKENADSHERNHGEECV